MLKILPFILIAVLTLGGLGYWRYVASNKPVLTTPVQEEAPLEVPKTLPQASMEDRVKALENLVSKLVTQVNILKSSPSSNSTDVSKLNSLDASVTELKARVSALEKAIPTSAVTSSGQATVFIPLGSGGTWENKDWYSTSEYQILLDPANYPAYTGMNLEVVFRMYQKSGVGSVRLYNVTDEVGYPQVDTTSDAPSLQTSASFKLPTGTKTYRLQVKSSEVATLAIQSARLRVSF